MRRTTRHVHVALIMCIALALVGFIFSLSSTFAAQDARGTVEHSWRLARERGAYAWQSEMTLTGQPLPSLENVGLSSTVQHLTSYGDIDLGAGTLTMRLIGVAALGGAASGTLELRI